MVSYQRLRGQSKGEGYMPSAVCPHCGEPAFSSAEFTRPWTCPTCKKLVIPSATASDGKKSTVSRDPIIDHYSRFWTHE